MQMIVSKITQLLKQQELQQQKLCWELPKTKKHPNRSTNKSTATALGTSDVLFPTQNAVKTYVDAASTGIPLHWLQKIANRINADDSIKNNLATETARATNGRSYQS